MTSVRFKKICREERERRSREGAGRRNWPAAVPRKMGCRKRVTYLTGKIGAVLAELCEQVKRNRKNQSRHDRHRFDNAARFEWHLRFAAITSRWPIIRPGRVLISRIESFGPCGIFLSTSLFLKPFRWLRRYVFRRPREASDGKSVERFALCVPHAAQEPWLYRNSRARPRSRHRRKHCHLQRFQWHALATASGQRPSADCLPPLEVAHRYGLPYPPFLS